MSMSDFVEVIGFARSLLGVPADLMVDQVNTTPEWCTVVFADNQATSFRIVEIIQGGRSIPRPAAIVELEVRANERNRTNEMSVEHNPADGAASSVNEATTSSERANDGESSSTAAENVERVEDFVAPIDKATAQKKSTAPTGKLQGIDQYPLFCQKREMYLPKPPYNVLCKCPGKKKVERPATKMDLRQKALQNTVSKLSPKTLRPIPSKSNATNKTTANYKIPKVPIKPKPIIKANEPPKQVQKAVQFQPAPSQPPSPTPAPPTSQPSPPDAPPAPPVLPQPQLAEQPVRNQAPPTEKPNPQQPVQPTINVPPAGRSTDTPRSSLQSPPSSESEYEFRQFMRERIWQMKENMQKMTELQTSTQTELMALRKKNEELEQELKISREQQREVEDRQRRGTRDRQIEDEEERIHREEYRERYGRADEEEYSYRPTRVSEINTSINEEREESDGEYEGTEYTENQNLGTDPNTNSNNMSDNVQIQPPLRSDNIGLFERDTTKLDYHLTSNKNFKMWKLILDMELGLKRLSDVVDENVPPPRIYTQNEMNERKKVVRGIIISHIDECYQEQVIEFENPKDMLDRLYKIKREEINDTTVSVKDQLRNLKFQLGVDTVYNFNTKFDDLVRRYELVSGEKMSELDRKDAYYHIVSKTVPSVKEAAYRDRAKGEGDGFTFEQMRIYIQQIEAENKSVPQGPRGRGGLMMAATSTEDTRCFKCGDRGHHSTVCTRRQGEYKCYKCEGFGHKSFQCPNLQKARYTKRNNSQSDGDGGSYKKFRPNRYEQGRRGGFTRRGRGGYLGNRTRGGRFRQSKNLENENRGSAPHYNTTQQNFSRGNNSRRGRGRKRGSNNSHRDNKPFSQNQNRNYSNSRTGVSNRSDQQENKVMPVQNQANLVVPPPVATVPLPPPPIPMPFWFVPPQPQILHTDSNLNSSTIDERLKQIRDEEERQRHSYDVTSTYRDYHERRDRRDRDDDGAGAAYMAGTSRGRGRGRMLRV